MFSRPSNLPAPGPSSARALFAAVLTLGLTTACSDGGGTPDADVDGDTRPGDRTFLLAARAEGYDVTRSRPAYPTLDTLTIPLSPGAAPAGAPLPPDRPLEAVVLPVDLLGVPWSSFDGPDNQPTSLPAPWLAEIERLEQLVAEANLPVVLALSPLSPEHDTLAPLASDGAGALVLNPTWRPSCYDPGADANPTRHRDQFAGYARWLAERFRPRAIILAQRLNLYEKNCGAAPFASVKAFAAAAHQRIAASTTLSDRPLTVVTFDVEDLYGFPAQPGRCVSVAPKDCLATRAPLMADLGVDQLGLESHPWRAFGDVSAVPADWLSAVAAAQTLPALVASTGAPAARLDSQRNACGPFIESTELAQRLWLDQVLAFSTAQKAPLLVWRTLVDPVDTAIVTGCPCGGDVPLCTHLDGLGNRRDDRRGLLTSGLVASDGAPRQALTLWRSLLTP